MSTAVFVQRQSRSRLKHDESGVYVALNLDYHVAANGASLRAIDFPL